MAKLADAFHTTNTTTSNLGNKYNVENQNPRDSHYTIHTNTRKGTVPISTPIHTTHVYSERKQEIIVPPPSNRTPIFSENTIKKKMLFNIYK